MFLFLREQPNNGEIKKNPITDFMQYMTFGYRSEEVICFGWLLCCALFFGIVKTQVNCNMENKTNFIAFVRKSAFNIKCTKRKVFFTASYLRKLFLCFLLKIWNYIKIFEMMFCWRKKNEKKRQKPGQTDIVGSWKQSMFIVNKMFKDKTHNISQQ